MTQEHVEREDKYDIDPDFVLPDLSELVPDGRVAFATYELKAVYYDTEQQHLQRRRITLRRRTGGHDAGWHLKLPNGDARTEISVTSSASSPPRELSALLLGVRRGTKLARAATLETHRSAVELVNADDEVLAEVVVDGVHAVKLGGEAQMSDWREAEVELGAGGDAELLERIAAVIIEAGARPSASVSKFARAVGTPPERRRPKRLGGLVDDYLQVQYDAVNDGDLALRRDENVIHVTRVAIRRIRSTLRVFAALFDAGEVERLETELVWFAALLGAVRDLDVQRARLTEQVAAVPTEILLGPVESRLSSMLAAQRGEAWATLRKAMDGKRYLSLLTLLDRWQDDPPLTGAAQAKRKEVASYVAKARKKTQRRLRAAIAPTGTADDLHRARKAEKRYRYATELAVPVLGRSAEREVDRAKEMQDLIGEHQDATVSLTLLRAIGLAAADARENAFTYGLLWEQQRRSQADVRAEVARRYS